MARENIENQLRAIDHAAFRGFFDVPLLYRREITVKDDQRRLVCRGLGTNFIQLAAAHQRRRISGIAHLENGPRDFRPGAAGEFNQL